ncbi:GNAT family N-acetyltransferase [Mesorhizobium sp.]|uniref:GNAT family N-acetyltransferase n=1 Tax=Mesorhizobium sp. TaxID=1871066 RepID=UPI0025F64149|nr:GNAT family N-acetyltransferase [Mesorhizobium sp.]
MSREAIVNCSENGLVCNSLKHHVFTFAWMMYHISYSISVKCKRQRNQKSDPGLNASVASPSAVLASVAASRYCYQADSKSNALIIKDTVPAEITDLAIGYHRLPAGKLANAVTWMEARAPKPALAQPLAMTRIVAPDCVSYRTIFLEIGGPWLWDRVSEMSDAEIAAHFADTRQHLYYGYDETGAHVGMVEFFAADHNEIEITYFGLFPTLTGRGFGKRLMAGALDLAWRLNPSRIWLHTSSFDHHSVIDFYNACGFVPFATGFEILDDPRLKGTLPRNVAPQIPLIEAEWSGPHRQHGQDVFRLPEKRQITRI